MIFNPMDIESKVIREDFSMYQLGIDGEYFREQSPLSIRSYYGGHKCEAYPSSGIQLTHGSRHSWKREVNFDG